MRGYLVLGNGMRLALTPGSSVSLGRQHVRLTPAATSVARCQCEVTVSSNSGTVLATSRGFNPTTLLASNGRIILQQGDMSSLCLAYGLTCAPRLCDLDVIKLAEKATCQGKSSSPV